MEKGKEVFSDYKAHLGVLTSLVSEPQSYSKMRKNNRSNENSRVGTNVRLNSRKQFTTTCYYARYLCYTLSYLTRGPAHKIVLR